MTPDDYYRRAMRHEEVCEVDTADMLFAAADMFEALLALDTYGDLGRLESNASGNPEWERVSERINAARDAIKKAFGK